MSKEMKCPSCGSVDIVSQVLAHGYAYVDMQTGDLIDLPDECDYDVSDLYEFYCQDCEHEWDDNVPREVFAMWEKKREEWFESLEDRRKRFNELVKKQDEYLKQKGIVIDLR